MRKEPAKRTEWVNRLRSRYYLSGVSQGDVPVKYLILLGLYLSSWSGLPLREKLCKALSGLDLVFRGWYLHRYQYQHNIYIPDSARSILHLENLFKDPRALNIAFIIDFSSLLFLSRGKIVSTDCENSCTFISASSK